MTAVALEASARPESVALRAGGETSALRLDAAASHASDLFARLDELLAARGLAPRSVEAVLVGTGPGSFTGLRVAIAAAMGVARGAGARVRGVPSLEALFYAELAPGEEGCALLDARAGELCFAHYRRTDEDVVALAGPHVRPVDEPVALPRGARLFAEPRALQLARLDAHPDVLRAPDATDVLALGLVRLARLGPQPPESLEPLYLRPFAARRRTR